MSSLASTRATSLAPAVLHALLDSREDPTKDVDLLFFQARAREKPPQARQQSLRMRGAQKIDGDQRPLALFEEALDLFLRRRFERGRGPDRVSVCGDAQLVGGDLHRGRQIQ